MVLEGNKLAKQFPSISEIALQQEEPIMLNWPLTSEPKTRLKGNNLGKQWSLTKVMALQQVGPKKLNLPLKSEFITSVRHPGTPERDDQHSCMS